MACVSSGMNALDAVRHRRHLKHLRDAAAELDANIRLAARELAKHDETEQIRTSLALAVCGTAMATDRIDDAIARLSDPSSWMGVVA